MGREADWGDAVDCGDGLTVHVLTARHFSGRMLQRNRTLWASFAIETRERRIYYSGDSGYGPHFKAIGETFGGFDLVLLDSGQYDPSWPDVHMTRSRRPAPPRTSGPEPRCRRTPENSASPTTPGTTLSSASPPPARANPTDSRPPGSARSWIWPTTASASRHGGKRLGQRRRDPDREVRRDEPPPADERPLPVCSGESGDNPGGSNIRARHRFAHSQNAQATDRPAPKKKESLCVDLVSAADKNRSAALRERIESRHGTHPLDHAERLGLGSQDYALTGIDA
jgi:hypothetical protein